jgi:uncharacterized membrane protein YccF (DUF307 family)
MSSLVGFFTSQARQNAIDVQERVFISGPFLLNRNCSRRLTGQRVSHGSKQMGFIGNVLWFIFGGFVMGLGWWLVGLLALITIVGIPWAKACFVIGQFAFFPFGKVAISRKNLSGQDDIGTGVLGSLGNILWFIFAGVWLAIGHLLSAVFCFVTIIGIPFGLQHLKLASLALAPIGKTIVDKKVDAVLNLQSGP